MYLGALPPLFFLRACVRVSVYACCHCVSASSPATPSPAPTQRGDTDAPEDAAPPAAGADAGEEAPAGREAATPAAVPPLASAFDAGTEFVCGECADAGRRLHVAVAGCPYHAFVAGGGADDDAAWAAALPPPAAPGAPAGAPGVPHLVLALNANVDGGPGWGPTLAALAALPTAPRVVVTCATGAAAATAAAALAAAGLPAGAPVVCPFASPLPAWSAADVTQCARDNQFMVGPW